MSCEMSMLCSLLYCSPRFTASGSRAKFCFVIDFHRSHIRRPLCAPEYQPSRTCRSGPLFHPSHCLAHVSLQLRGAMCGGVLAHHALARAGGDGAAVGVGEVAQVVEDVVAG